jgi:hypothetical protein
LVYRKEIFSKTTAINRASFIPIIAILFAFANWSGCRREKEESIVQDRLTDWLPPSATEVYSISGGGQDKTTLISFVCSKADLQHLRGKFAVELKGSWESPPLDRRTSDMVRLAYSFFATDNPPPSPFVDLAQMEYLRLPETKPYLLIGESVIISWKMSRIWFLSSDS